MVDPGFELGGGTHSQIVSVQNVLLGVSGGMPPPGKFWILGLLQLFLVQFWDKLLAKHTVLRVL